MLSIENATAIALLRISETFGKDYVRSMFSSSGYSYELFGEEEIMLEYFCGFKSDEISGKWTEFAYVRVNRETKEAIFLDYRLPNGERMLNPIKSTGRFA